jgi:hypothetical protein
MGIIMEPFVMLRKGVKVASKILILSVFTFFLLVRSTLAISLSDNLTQNYFDNTSFELKSVDHQIMSVNYSATGENLATNYDINNMLKDIVTDASDDESIVTKWSNFQTFHFVSRALASYGNGMARDADICMFVGDIVELNTVRSVPVINQTAFVPEPATIVLMGFGLFGLGCWVRRLQKTKAILF